LITFSGLFKAKIQATKGSQIVTQVISYVVLQFQVIIVNVSAFLITNFLTQLNLQITIQLVSKTVFLINSRSVYRTCGNSRHSNSQKKLLHFL